MKDKIILCAAILGVAAGLIWYIWISSKPSLLRNEANGSVNTRRFKGYKESLKTPINSGTPLYGEQVTGWATGTYHTDKGA